MVKKSKLTLKDVALRLGVSTATISNAFNRPDQLSERKRSEILTACQEIGYDGPNKAAQILRKGQSNIIALVTADSIDYTVSDPVASAFIQGVTRVLKQHKKHMLLYSGDSQSIRDVVDFVDGFICYGAPRNPAIAEEIARQSKPAVAVDFDMASHGTIHIDNESASYEIAKLAVKPGDHVAILGLRLIDSTQTCRIYDTPLLDTQHSISHRRLDGYMRALHEAGIELSNDWIWHLPESHGAYARQAAKEVLGSHSRPNVILCMSDIIALELLQEAMAMGIKVPQQLKITGFDGIDEAARTRPYLTTICQSNVEKGIAAANMLLSNQQQDCVLPYEIKMGETV